LDYPNNDGAINVYLYDTIDLADGGIKSRKQLTELGKKTSSLLQELKT